MENDFRLTAEELKKKITPKTKLLVLPYPNNPTGAIMEKQDLEEIAKVLRGTNILVLSDELYAELTYGESRHFSLANLEGMSERTIVINGFSKAFAMTGWRLGFACGPSPIISAMTKIHQFAIMSAPTTSQYSAIEAIKNGDEDIKYMREQYNMRRRFLLSGLKEIGIDCFTPLGAFYLFPSIKKFGLSSEEFCERLLREQKCAVIPGNAFGDCGEGHIRISYAYSTEKIAEALKRIKMFIESL
jgi:aminotransferase